MTHDIEKYCSFLLVDVLNLLQWKEKITDDAKNSLEEAKDKINILLEGSKQCHV
jgi:hypothetical protein